MSDFDFTYMSLGAGVQSGTLAEMIAEGELSGPEVCIFADTGDEPQYVLDYVKYITPRLAAVGVPVVTVSAGDLVADAMKPDQRFAAIPVFTLVNGKAGRMRRQCTSEYKIEPIEKWVRQHLLSEGKAKLTKDNKIRLDKKVRVECWLGLSLDEVARLKPSLAWWVDNRWPLVDLRMSRNDCKQWLFKHGLPIPGKSSCRICPYHNNAYLRDMQDNRPDDWQHTVEFDRFLRSGDSRLVASAKGKLYLHRDCMPLEEVDLSESKNGQTDFFDVCDEGYCFI